MNLKFATVSMNFLCIYPPMKTVLFRNWVPVEMKLWGAFQMGIEKDLCFHWKNCSTGALDWSVMVRF